MQKYSSTRLLRGALQGSLSLGLAAGLVPDVVAQDVPNSSLYTQRLEQLQQVAPSGPANGIPGSLNAVAAPFQAQSWYEIPLPPAKEVKVHDIITIRVDTGSRLSESAQLQRRRTSQYDAILNDWILLEGLRAIRPAPQSEGDQRVQGNLSQNNRVTGQLDTAESLKFDIAATVAAVLPNGNIVLEAHKEVEVNNEKWMHSLSGVCRREDIGPNNTVLSKDIANLRVQKKDLGQIRDSYKRGWLTRWWDQVNPF